MHYTIEALIKGNQVASYFPIAVNRWKKMFETVDATDFQAIGKAATNMQIWFEQNCGGRWPGQEVMVWAGIGRYYSSDNGFGDNLGKAKAMYQGLLMSGCSIEVHGHAREAAKLYEELEENAQ